jgi:hypothetical protein
MNLKRRHCATEVASEPSLLLLEDECVKTQHQPSTS